ncbi:MAG: extracellular solute-binding protein [Clostridiales bacterium]|jgi:DNA-binding CsgD family transcriptional regulator|nr:extracellular solute-binding protein [Clostridiales bacterium]
MAVVYPQTAVTLAEKDVLANLNEYFTGDDLSPFVPQFIEEGRLGGENLYILPVAKSSEVLYLNRTLFNRFSEETGVAEESLATFEGIAEAAEIYYKWSGGKAFFYPEGLFNQALIGFKQLGGDKVVFQRGGGVCVTKSNTAREYASCLFLKWITEPERNLNFCVGIGYMPVKKTAFDAILAGDYPEIANPVAEKALLTAAEMRKRYQFFVAIMFLLVSFGEISLGGARTAHLFSDELENLSEDITVQFGNASVQAVRFSEKLTEKYTAFMKEKGLSNEKLSNHPEIINELCGEFLPILTSSLDSTDCSGAFITLNATINPNIANAENSKAGLLIRNVEPNIRGMGTDRRYLLRGDSSLAGNGRLNLQSRWSLEFDVEGQPFWSEPQLAANANPNLALSRLVYWCPKSPLSETNGACMVCCVPVLGETGGVIGVCGFEINQMNFSLRYITNIDGFHRSVFMFSLKPDNGIHLGNALFSGNVAVYDMLAKDALMRTVSGSGDGFTLYRADDGTSFIGMPKEINLYASDSPFAENVYSAAVLAPLKDYAARRNALRMRLALIFFGVTALGVLTSVVISRIYLNPLIPSLKAIRSGNLQNLKTNIAEIDTLIEQIRKLRANNLPLPSDFVGGIMARIEALDYMQARIFRSYVKGKSDREILSEFFITKHALDAQKERIYQKLGIPGRASLTIYIELLKTCSIADKFE